MRSIKKKVLMIPSGGIGIDGITSCIMNYYRNINHNEISMTFVATKILGEKKHFEAIKEEIILMGDSVVEINRKQNPIKYILELVKIIKKNQFDIMHVHGSSSLMSIELLAAKLGGIPVRISHSHNTKCNHNILNKILKPVFLRLTTTRLACGEAAGKWLFDNKSFEVIKNGVEVERFRYSSDKRKKVIKELCLSNKKVIGHVGNFNEQKNHIFMVDVLESLVKIDDSYHLLLVGDGAKRQEVEEKLRKKGILNNVTFLGRRTDIQDILQCMDFMILPSLYEGLPLVVIEWQCNGLKSILSDNVTEEVKVTDLVSFMSLNNSAQKWAEKIDEEFDYDRSDEKNTINIINAGYDIKNNIGLLTSVYDRELKKFKY